MISRDQAKQAGDAILEPSRRDLAKRKERLAKIVSRRDSPLFAALFGAIATVIAYDYFDNIVSVVCVGAAVGWMVGSILQRPIGKSGEDKT